MIFQGVRMIRKSLFKYVILIFFISACTSPNKIEDSAYQPARSTASVPSVFMQSLPPVDPERKHVHLMHLDGFRSDVFKILLENGRLPHFEFLLGRGKISFEASTVDKSETFKVIESYLTGRRDTFITGWWQFDRTRFKFKNYWIDPPEVVNYELGLMFPTAPTIYDVVSYKAGPSSVAAGFSLHRRGVPARNYTRNFAIGYKSISEHTYFDQAHATMGSFIELLKSKGKNPSTTLPKFTTSVLAPADEWGHLRGIVDINNGQGTTTCFHRGDPKTEIIFKMFENPQMEGIVMPQRHFTSFKRGGMFGAGSINQFCIDRFGVDVSNQPPSADASSTVGIYRKQWVNPMYILGMIQVDVELGRLIDEMRRIQFICLEQGNHCYSEKNPRGISRYMNNKSAEGSLFENTLFLFAGDHGMVDTKHMMAENNAYNRSNGRSNSSQSKTLLDLVNAGVFLKTPGDQDTRGLFGINDTKLPKPLKYPFEDSSWQSPAIRAKVQEARLWAQSTFTEVQQAIKNKQYSNYWWLFFLKAKIVDPKVHASTEPIKSEVIKVLTALYLQGDLCSVNPQCYSNEEAKFVKKYFDQNVRLVYGGAALNNAEFFLPSENGWGERPSGQYIFEALVGDPKQPNRKTVIDALQDIESVGLIFVRGNNEKFHPSRPSPETTQIYILDAMDNVGVIHIKRDAKNSIMSFAYERGSEKDPLDYGDLAQPSGSQLIYRTYDEWNQLSVERKHYFHNVVAGMGSYLFSNNPHIGDISVMHRAGWNFGDNGGGHGGVHREEKLTLMMASGPGVTNGVLQSKARFRVNPRTQTVEQTSYLTSPTVVDIAPTALAWLGYGRDSLYEMILDGDFARHMKNWKAEQSKSFTDDFIKGFESEVRGTSMDNMIDLRSIRPRLKRLFQFIDNQNFEPPNGYLNRQPDGNVLHIGK